MQTLTTRCGAIAVLITLATAALLHAGAPVDLSFQEGVEGYSATLDTHVSSNVPDTDQGTQAWFRNSSNSPTQDALLLFNALFGPGAGQVPSGSAVTINSATLTFRTSDPSQGVSSSISFHRMLTSWNESSTYNSLGAGVQTDDAEAVTVADAVLSHPWSGSAFIAIDVTSSLQAWASGDSNLGWVMKAAGLSGNFASFATSENGVSFRPLLEVTYTIPEPTTIAVLGLAFVLVRRRK